LLRLFDRWTSYGIAINAHTEPPVGLPTAVILHGHYRDWFARFPQSGSVPGRLAYFGLIRPYKGVEDLIAAFRGLPDDGLSLTVSGKPRTPELTGELRAGAAGDDRITLELEYVSDERLAARVSEAELVVLPYREMHNSGAALAALSMSRPVLLPANAVNVELGDEMGPGWVLTYDGDPTTEVLRQGLAELAATERSPEPNLSRREWSETGRRHVEAYAEARRLVRR
jgi:beta-1,4-mannosyltransferase